MRPPHTEQPSPDPSCALVTAPSGNICGSHEMLALRGMQAPKAYLVDSGLLAFLLGADEDRIATDDQVTGKVLENFVVMEVVKHVEWRT